MELKKYKLADIAKIEISGVDKKTIEGETPVRLCNFVDVYYNWAVTKEKAKAFMTASAKQTEIDKCSIGKGMVAITKDSETRDDIGIATYIADDFEDVLLGYHCALIIPNPAIVDGKYLNAFMHTRYIQKYFENNASGSGQRYTLSNDTISNIPVLLPSIEEQHTIGKLLADLDRKIELNKQINDNLEAMAKQLYDYWFVQFDFPNEEGKPYKSSGGAMVWNEKLKRKIPNGWTVETVGTYANCKSGYAIKSSNFKAKGIPVIKIGNIQEDYTLNMNGCQYIENNTNKLFYVYQNDVVIAMTGATIGKFAIVPFSETGYFVNQRVGKFEFGNNPIKKMPYLINSLKIDYFRNQIFQLASGCAQPNISVEQINNISLLYPSTKILSEYNMKCKWMYEQIANCRYQIDVLTKLRDKLLPLLMNGQALVNYHLSDD